jgi:hypothetical protein
MTNEVKEAIKVIENALRFYAEEGISSDEKAKGELDNAWNIVKEKKNYGYGYDDSNSIAIVWEIDDVKSIRPDLDDDKCMEVLGYADKKHDASIGISWETLEWHCDYLFPVKEEA